MAKEGRDLVKEAVQDARSLKEAAVEAAKNQLLESMAPKLRTLVENTLKKGLRSEDTDRLRRGIEDNAPGESHTGFEESKERGEDKMDVADKKQAAAPGEQELDLESLAGFFPHLAEMPDESTIPTLGEMDADADPAAAGDKEFPVAEAGDFPDDEVMKAESKKDDEKEKDKMDEEIEISESELRKVYEAALQTEVQVKKGFSDMTPSGELDDVVKDVDKGLADFKKGEHTWEKETPPAKQDFTVKEMIQRGVAENKALRAENAKLSAAVKQLFGKLQEVNLFNSKVLHVQKFLNTNARLTAEQKKVVLESIDRARTLDEVKMVYETIANSFKVATALSEGKNPRKPTADAQRARKSGAPDQKVLSESVDRGSNNQTFERFKLLAGLK